MKERRSPQYSKHHMPHHSGDRNATCIEIFHKCRNRDAHQAFYAIENTPQDDPLWHHDRLIAEESDPQEAFQLALRCSIRGQWFPTALDREGPIWH